MNKTNIKNFAIWARNKLRSEIAYKAGLLGISEKGIAEPLTQSTDDLQIFDIGTSQPVKLEGKTAIEQRRSLVAAIKAKRLPFAEAFDAVIEEVAYTWFNRLIAVRFMEVNDYLPSRMRVLSSDNPAKAEPDFVTSPFDTDIEFTDAEKDYIDELKDHSKSDELFQFMFIRQCNKLNEILPELFEKTNDYTELLLNVVGDNDDSLGQVEIIGWLYQYYISEKHESVINPLYGKGVKTEDIPSATQLFTTDWVVRYMVENSLGKYWIENKPNSSLKDTMVYFRSILSENHSQKRLQPQELKVLDPCVGSGHILVYAFNILLKIYTECGYTERDAVKYIVETNLYGLEIDSRAAQLAYFAVMMCARQKDRRFFKRNICPNIFVVPDSITLSNEDILALCGKNRKTAEYLLKVFKYGKTAGSALSIQVEIDDLLSLEQKITKLQENAAFCEIEYLSQVNELSLKLLPLIEITKVMKMKYVSVITNPPYLNRYNDEMKRYLVATYPDYYYDMFSVFMYKCLQYCTEDGYAALMTPNVWMYIKSYDKLRRWLIDEKSITSFLLLAKGAFFKEATVDVCSFVLSNKKELVGKYTRLEQYKGDMEKQRKAFLNADQIIKDNNEYLRKIIDFNNIPEKPIAFWISESMLSTFQENSIGDISESKAGIVTGNDKYFFRLWFEIAVSKITFNATDFRDKKKYRFVPINKGGSFRRYYGNYEYVINIYDLWNSPAKTNVSVRRSEPDYYFKKALTWSYVTTGKSSFRITDNKLAATASPNLFFHNEDNLYYVLAITNSKLSQKYFDLLNPTINLNVTNVSTLPLIQEEQRKGSIIDISKNNIVLCKDDWDSFETSWDFGKHPLVVDSLRRIWDRTESTLIADCFTAWEQECNDRFNKLKANEEELNRIFIDIYGLQDELTPEVEDKDVTVRKADLQRDIRSFISYAVGCMFGRYSLDSDGLAYAGGAWDSTRYKTFIPDEDNCIPITDTKYFDDDIVGRFCEFIKVVYGEDTLEENLDYIAQALGNKGNSSREVIRNYFLNDFYKDHCKIYQKRPIYWLFDSGKQNGFKALIYIHRYNADTIGNLRVEYLHRVQRIYESEIEREQDTIDHTTNAREKKVSENRKEKLQRQLKETKEYDEKIAHLALSRIEIDLDDGVKTNYDKIQTGRDGKKLDVLGKI